MYGLLNKTFNWEPDSTCALAKIRKKIAPEKLPKFF